MATRRGAEDNHGAAHARGDIDLDELHRRASEAAVAAVHADAQKQRDRQNKRTAPTSKPASGE